MQTLEQCYEEISQDDTRWSYYKNPLMCINQAWLNNDKAYNFIRDYFNYAGKSRVFEDANLEKKRDFVKERACHVISTFLLGIKIAESFGIKMELRDDCNMNFQYYWFLTCLYHDIGYAYEDANENKCERLRMVCEDGIEALQEICDLQYVHDRAFKTYSKHTVDFYLRCRADCHENKPVIDHGIVGGLLLYDKLRKQFAKAWKMRTKNADSRESFYVWHEGTGRKLHLSNMHYNAYAKASDAIITHNIWASTLQEYIKKYGAREKLFPIYLNRKITIANKLCFILSLADTLEPIKRGKNYLKSISIRQIDGSLGFELQADKNTFNALYQDIKTLETWVSVKVDINNVGNDCVSIKITE